MIDELREKVEKCDDDWREWRRYRFNGEKGPESFIVSKMEEAGTKKEQYESEIEVLEKALKAQLLADEQSKKEAEEKKR